MNKRKKAGDMMTREEYDNWIKSLKEGDKVAVRVNNYGQGGYYIIKTIKRITPTRKIRLDNNELYDSNGYKSGSEYSIGTWIRPVTDKVMRNIKHRELLYKVSNFDFKMLTLEKLEKIIEIIIEKD